MYADALWILPFISAGIGWFTNYIAIKMLFYPREEKRFLFMKFQGIFPKRQEEMARRQAKLVSRELFNTKDIKEHMTAAELTDKIHDSIDEEVDRYLREKAEKLPSILSPLISESVITRVKTRVTTETAQFVPRITDKFIDRLEEVDVEEMVYQKVKNFSSEKLEAMLMSVLKKELKYIEMAGGVLGFFVGLVQVLLIILTS